MNSTPAKLDALKLMVLGRLKAVVGLLGTVLNFLYSVQAVHPDARVQALIGLLTVLGIHQTPNL